MDVDILFDFIRDGLHTAFDFMRNTVVFKPSLSVFDFPVTIFDILLGFSTANTFLYLFGFLDDYDDVEIKE